MADIPTVDPRINPAEAARIPDPVDRANVLKGLGLNAIGASGSVPTPAIQSQTPLDIVKAEQTREAPEITTIQQHDQAAIDKADAAHAAQGAAPVLPDQKFEFKPPENSGLMAGLMMVIGALGGRKTMQPMTAALNNMTGMMQGLHKGDEEAYTRQKEEFDKNYQIAKDHVTNYYEASKRIDETMGYDLAKTKPAKEMLALEHGNAIDVAQAKAGMDKLEVENKKLDKELSDGAERLSIERRRITNEEAKESYLENKGQQWVKLKDGTIRQLFQNETQLPEGATLTTPATSGKSSHLTASEQKTQENATYAGFANNTLNELDSKGVRVPVSTEIFGTMYDPKVGGINQVMQQNIKDSLSTDDEKKAFIASLSYVIGVGHALGGARISGAQMQAIWNADIPSPSDTQAIVEYKAKARKNMLESLKKATGEEATDKKDSSGVNATAGKTLTYDRNAGSFH